MGQPLAGVIVAERAGRLATAAAGYLLADLGARVLRLESAAEHARLAALPAAEGWLRTGNKQSVALADGDAGAALWRRMRTEADIVLLDPAHPTDPDFAPVEAMLAAPPGRQVICVISPAGLGRTDLPLDATDPLIQAAAGSMAVTGYAGGRPERVQVPVAELSAAVLAGSAILAALQVQRRDGVGQLIDLSLIEVMTDQLRTHVAMVGAGTRPEFRIGCRHPVCCPWNSYRARDGWVLICTSSDAQWHLLLELIGHAELKAEPRYASAAARRAVGDEVDALVQGWVGMRSADDVVRAVSAVGVPVGPARTIPQVVADPLLRRRGTVREQASAVVFGCAVHLSRAAEPAAVPPIAASTANLGGHAIRPPLDGVRVVEISRYAAGPIAGLVLAALGAEVLKIESPGGEECRRWTPRFGAVSGYFANYNAGKRSVVLDLRQPDGRRGLEALIGSADVVLQNVRPGVMERIGLGAAAATERFPRLVYASLSGYGLGGPALAALDTVIQAEFGLTALIGDGDVPCRMGFSIADQLAGHITALGILAALTERAASGRGQIVDSAMCDAVVWLTQLAWPDGRPVAGNLSQLRTADGWLVAVAPEPAVRDAIGDIATMTRAAAVAALAGHGITAAAVLEPDEVFSQPLIQARRSLDALATEGGGTAPVLVMPLGLTATPVLRPAQLAALGADNAALLGTLNSISA